MIQTCGSAHNEIHTMSCKYFFKCSFLLFSVRDFNEILALEKTNIGLILKIYFMNQYMYDLSVSWGKRR